PYNEKESQQVGFSMCTEQPASHFNRGIRLELSPEKGEGWAEMLQIDNGLDVGLCNYRLKKCLEPIHFSMITPVQFTILLSGRFDVQVQDEVTQTIGPGDIWFGHNHQQQVIYSQSHNDTTICGLTIGLPAQLIERWLGNYSDGITRGLERLLSHRSRAGSATDRNLFPLVKGMRESAGLIRMARKLMAADHQTILDKLHFESLALELLAQLSTLEEKPTNCQLESWGNNTAFVDNAVDILRQEWGTPPSISSLAKRVGTNECYLKKGFRDKMGMSIGEYICELRMARALDLLETGKHTVTETALAVGYNNLSHFSIAFKKFYGKSPLRYLSRTA
ncbi:hypothetical protein CSB45_15380, partial [candidate division KSB3 bacterium]